MTGLNRPVEAPGAVPVTAAELRPKTGLRRRFLRASIVIFSTIVVLGGAALVSLERLDGLLSQMQRDSLAETRGVLALAESTTNLSLAARRFREVDDRQTLSQAERALRDELRRFSELAQSLPALKQADAPPAIAPSIVDEADRLNEILSRLAATVAEAIDAQAGIRIAAQDLKLVKTALQADAVEHPVTAIALALATTALASSDRTEVEAQRVAYMKLMGQDGRPMALSLLTPLFERRQAVIEVETRQRSLIVEADSASREIARLARNYTGLLDAANRRRMETIAMTLRLGKIGALVVGLAVLGAALVIANSFLRGAIADLGGIAEAMRRLAAGDASARAPGTHRHDEIGALADAFAVFKAQVAEREHLQRQLQQAERLEAIGRFTGGIAHDFNNILTAVSTNLQLIQDSTEPNSANNHRAIRALEATEAGSATVQQLLTFGRRRTLDPTPTDIDAVIEAVADLLQENFGGSIRLETAREGDRALPLVALVDPGQLENALINLLFNARDAIAETGRIRLSAAPTADGMIRITVEDTGVGMPPDVLDHVFEPFFTTKPAPSGNGLGLSTVYGFVHQSGGRIAIRSAPGEGTTVDIELPRYLSLGGGNVRV